MWKQINLCVHAFALYKHTPINFTIACKKRRQISIGKSANDNINEWALQRRKYEFHSIIALHNMQSYLSFWLYLHSIFPLFFLPQSLRGKVRGRKEQEWDTKLERNRIRTMQLQLQSLNFHICVLFSAIKRVESHLVAVFLSSYQDEIFEAGFGIHSVHACTYDWMNGCT